MSRISNTEDSLVSNEYQSDSESEDCEHHYGLLFAIVNKEGVQMFLSEAPVFRDLWGGYTSPNFVTKEMYNYMKSILNKNEDYQITCEFEDASDKSKLELLWGYALTLDYLQSGERSSATFVHMVGF